MRNLKPKNPPVSGDWFVLGLYKYPVAGYDLASNRLLYYKSYADRDDPIEVPMQDVSPIDKDWPHPRWWIAKHRVGTGQKLSFKVSFAWSDGPHVWHCKASSMKDARNRAIQHIAIRLCNISPSMRAFAVSEAKHALCNYSGRSTFSLDLLTVEVDLRN